MNTFTASQQSAPRTLRRATEGRLLGGVAAGLGRHLGTDPWVIRMIFILIPLGLIPYLVAWALLPGDGERTETGPIGSTGALAVVAGATLVAVGALVAVDASWPDWIDGRYVGAALLAALGVALVVRGARE